MMDTTITSIFVSVAGTVVLFFGVRAERGRRRLERGSRQWPSTTGRVVQSGTTQVDNGESMSYRARVRYEYAVGNQRYVGDRISLRGAESIFSKVIQSIVERYPVSASVKVFYDPQQPNMAVLEHTPSSKWGLLPSAMTGGILLISGVLPLSGLLDTGYLQRAIDRASQQVTIGVKDKVAYRGDAKPQDARVLGEALKAKGYFKGRGEYVYLRKGKDGAFVSFEVREGVWDDAPIVAAFERLGREIAPAVGVYPLNLELGYSTPDDPFKARKTLVINGPQSAFVETAPDSDRP